MSHLLQQLKQNPLIATLPTAALHQIVQETEERTYRRRQVVYFAEQKNDYIFYLVSGRVKLLKTGASGREVTLDIVSPDELFGESNLFSPNHPYGASAEILEDSKLLAMRRTSIAAPILGSMDALRAFADLQVQRRAAAEQRLAEFVFYDVPTRLAHLLGRLATFYPGAADDSVPIRAKLTHQELANLVGSTRETTTLILNDFKRRKLIEFQGRSIVALDPGGLITFDSHTAQQPVADAGDTGLLDGAFQTALERGEIVPSTAQAAGSDSGGGDSGQRGAAARRDAEHPAARQRGRPRGVGADR